MNNRYNQALPIVSPDAQETVLHHGSIELRDPIYPPDYVQARIGIDGYDYLGGVVVPTRIALNHSEVRVETFHLFRQTSTTAPLEHANRDYNAALEYVLPFHVLGSVTVINGESLKFLREINNRSTAGQSTEAAQQQFDERSGLSTLVVSPGYSETVGKKGAFKALFTPDDTTVSRSHFTVTVTSEGATKIEDHSANGTMYIPEPLVPWFYDK